MLICELIRRNMLYDMFAADSLRLKIATCDKSRVMYCKIWKSTGNVGKLASSVRLLFTLRFVSTG
jgi:hypothetical protein